MNVFYIEIWRLFDSINFRKSYSKYSKININFPDENRKQNRKMNMKLLQLQKWNPKPAEGVLFFFLENLEYRQFDRKGQWIVSISQRRNVFWSCWCNPNVDATKRFGKWKSPLAERYGFLLKEWINSISFYLRSSLS